MTVTDSRVRAGVLTIDGHDHSCQPTSVSISPNNTTGTDNTIEVLCGDKIDESTSGELEATLNLTAIADFTDADGVIAQSWKENGKTVPFTWQPTSNADDQWKGEVTVQAIEVGGAVGERLLPTVSWTITKLTLPKRFGGAVVIPKPVQTATPSKNAAAPGDTFAAESTITASDAAAAALLAGLGFVAAPTTQWTTGQKITVGTWDFHWNGTAWAEGGAS